MRRYPVGRQELIDLINQERPTWIDRARARTDAYVQSRDYTGGSEFWGEIKKVYIDLQFEKCAYCETKLQGFRFASKVHEVEHFRPKQSVKVWPNSSIDHLANFVPPCSTGTASPAGYYALSYHPFNYAIACTRCNSTLKSNYFPVRGARDPGGVDPSQMSGEDALLLYPISDIDDDPTALIAFDGVLAVPKQASGPAYERAVVTIRFFQLNHEDLTTRRASILAPLWLNLETLASNPPAEIAQQVRRAVDRACSPRSEFSACMSAFRARFEADPAGARQLGEMANLLADG
ncbi:hypothetical protein LJR039_003729 [Pseudorhodoferax sp. LjRoot39]|uniref:hypothetical protein n=1 Tax=Pseudorhodoferax sp. LjRoot39 TaxID=3342328 RepID=UPI003ED0B0A5